MHAKHYENPTMLFRVTAKNVGDVFFETHCRFGNLLSYYLRSRGVENFATLCELLVSDKLKSCLPPGELNYVLSLEGDDWFYPSKVAGLADTYAANHDNRYGQNQSQRFKPSSGSMPAKQAQATSEQPPPQSHGRGTYGERQPAQSYGRGRGNFGPQHSWRGRGIPAGTRPSNLQNGTHSTLCVPFCRSPVP